MNCQMYSDCRTPAVALIPTPAGDRIATCAECAPHQKEIDMTTTTLVEQFHDFLTGAADAALWSTHPMTADDFADQTADEFELGGDERTKLRGTLAYYARDWFVTYHPLIRRAMSGNPAYNDWIQVGHDWWLTTQGHGAGFWDRGLGTAGAALTATCDGYSDMLNLYVDEDGTLRVDTHNVVDFNESLDDSMPLAGVAPMRETVSPTDALESACGFITDDLFPDAVTFYRADRPEAVMISDHGTAPTFISVVVDGGEIETMHTVAGEWRGGLPGCDYPFDSVLDCDGDMTGFVYNRQTP